MISKAKFNTFVGSIGAAMGIFVFVAYIPQIIANIQGAKAQPWQPLFAAVSCRRDIGISDFSDFALNKGLY